LTIKVVFYYTCKKGVIKMGDHLLLMVV
jgi:hypothetical protein